MPTNLSPEALVAEQKYLEATTLPEKIRTLQEYISAIPKHKGTEKLLSILKTKLSKLKDESETQKKLKKGSGKPINIKKEGAGQVVLIGLTNSGKSSILSNLTGANLKIGNYPYTTQEPEVGVMNYDGVLIQMVESPALFQNVTISNSGKAIFSVIRNSDSIAIIIDLSDDPIKQLKLILEELEKNGIKINCKPPAIRIKKIGSGGKQFFGLHYFRGKKEDLMDILQEAGIHNTTVHFYEESTLTDFVEALDDKIVYRPAVIIANKGDLEGSIENFETLKSYVKDTISVTPISIIKEKGIDEMKKSVFTSLNLIRIYTKENDGTVSEKPLVIKYGATVNDVAKRLHNKFIKKFKYAKIYGPSAKFPGEKVGLDHFLKDKDIVQIFIQ